MSNKQNKDTIYILKFDNESIIKIGVTVDMPQRINKFRKEYSTDFDLTNSYAIGSYSKAKISALEKEFLATTLDYALKENDVARFSACDGFSELRYADCLPILLKLINYKIKLLPNDYYLFKSISLERNLVATLPEEIFNKNGETLYIQTNVSDKLIELIQNQISDFKDFNKEEIVNSVLARFIKQNKLELPKKNGNSYTRDKKTHEPFSFRGNWVWVKK